MAVVNRAGNPGKCVPALREVGTKVIPVVSSVALARKVGPGWRGRLIAEGMESADISRS